MPTPPSLFFPQRRSLSRSPTHSTTPSPLRLSRSVVCVPLFSAALCVTLASGGCIIQREVSISPFIIHIVRGTLIRVAREVSAVMEDAKEKTEEVVLLDDRLSREYGQHAKAVLRAAKKAKRKSRRSDGLETITLASRAASMMARGLDDGRYQ